MLVDLNVEPAWIQGYTGKNIIVGVVDDGKYWVNIIVIHANTIQNHKLQVLNLDTRT